MVPSGEGDLRSPVRNRAVADSPRRSVRKLALQHSGRRPCSGHPFRTAPEHAAAYTVAIVFTDSGHRRTTLVVTP